MVIVNKSVVAKPVRQNHCEHPDHYKGRTTEPSKKDTSGGEGVCTISGSGQWTGPYCHCLTRIPVVSRMTF